MIKPLGYYSNHELVQRMQNDFGNYLEELTGQEKLYLILSISEGLLSEVATLRRRKIVYSYGREIDTLPKNDREALLEPLAIYLREIPSAE
ncbi:hypothetical protein [Cylindrospermum sp. FACHB-282]|uniref:hypothetical protein n=1 Tax=Cylindrospermum sp. FACHB-282 TaxID=2692794 RepID=UPI0016822E20|nr:hypothetical protein [Cylindrospermum sp. FACHB-282]MBD2386926.1 hypothetical protein [Cylindrospermum sp. FACHB-282]